MNLPNGFEYHRAEYASGSTRADGPIKLHGQLAFSPLRPAYDDKWRRLDSSLATVSDLALERALLRDRWIVGACLALLVALACLWLWRDHALMAQWDESMAAMGMKEMEMEGGPMATSAAPAAYLVEAFVMWLIMMVAMMLPSAAPMILLYGKLARSGRQQGGVFASTTVFAGLYLAVWAGFSAVAALIQWALVGSGAISDMGLAFGDRRVAGALLIAAGLYQLTPLKYACLEKCRSPLSFLMRLWRPGLLGAARLGLTHGLYCLGCCAMLMVLLFVFGVMNLAWVACLAIVVLLEKVFPWGQRFGWLAGVAALAIGAAMILGFQP